MKRMSAIFRSFNGKKFSNPFGLAAGFDKNAEVMMSREDKCKIPIYGG